MDFKYLSSYANKDNYGSIKDITARGALPRSNFGSISSYGKYDNLFDFKTNFKSTQIKAPVPTKKIIPETNDELATRESDGKKLGLESKDKKSVVQFQDSFIPDIKKKPYKDPQYYQHNLGRKNFYSKFRDKIRRKEAKGGNEGIEAEPLSGVESEEEVGEEGEERTFIIRDKEGKRKNVTEDEYYTHLENEIVRKREEKEKKERGGEEKSEREYTEEIIKMWPPAKRREEEEEGPDPRKLAMLTKPSLSRGQSKQSSRSRKTIYTSEISSDSGEESDALTSLRTPKKPELKRSQSDNTASTASTALPKFTTPAKEPEPKEPDPTTDEITVISEHPQYYDPVINKATLYSRETGLSENKKNYIAAVLRHHGITEQENEKTSNSYNVIKLKTIYKNFVKEKVLKQKAGL